MNRRGKAVIIDDDDDIRDLLILVLQQSGFEAGGASTGAAGVKAVRDQQPSVVILDLGLPDFDGLEVVRRVREFSDAYIIMVTARMNQLDTLMALGAGADDYITKPFSPRELRARIAAMLRRSNMRSEPTVPAEDSAQAIRETARNDAGHDDARRRADTESSEVYRHNGLNLDVGARTVEIDSGPVDLTRTEFELLRAVMEAGRTIRSKPSLARRLRYEDYDSRSFISEADERAIEVHVGNLRRKLGDDSRAPKWLETVRGMGYRLTSKQLP